MATTASQSSLLPFRRAHSPARWRAPITTTRLSPTCFYQGNSCFSLASSLGNTPLISSSLGRRQHLRARVVPGPKSAPEITESLYEESELAIGGDGSGGSSGDSGEGRGDGSGDSGTGGGGGGDNNSGGGGAGDRKGEGEGESSRKKKKMAAMSLSQKLTLGYAALVGVGGIMGYVKSGSQKSLAAGGLSALLLVFVYNELPVRPTLAATVGLGISSGLLAVMGSRFKRSKKLFPAGIVSLVSFIMAGGYLHGFLRSLSG